MGAHSAENAEVRVRVPDERLDMDAIRKREYEATAGPWSVIVSNAYPRSVIAHGQRLIADLVVIDADAEFIAHAREDVPALLNDNDQLRAALIEADQIIAARLPFATVRARRVMRGALATQETEDATPDLYRSSHRV